MEINVWRDVLAPYSLAVDELVVKFNHIKNYQENNGIYSPIYSLSGRVKSIPSILEKVKKKQLSLDSIEDHIYDLGGLRIICQFLEDCYAIVDLIKARSDMEIFKINDYIANPKESGYRSIHVIIKYKVQLADQAKDIFLEIQIRTMGMNCWSTIEHSLQYKYKSQIPDDLKKRLNGASRALLTSEEELSSIRSEVMDIRETKILYDKMVSDIILTILNIYQKNSKREALRIQNEFFEIYDSGNYEKLKHFYKELDVIAEGLSVQSLS